MKYLGGMFTKGTYKISHIKQCNTKIILGKFWLKPHPYF